MATYTIVSNKGKQILIHDNQEYHYRLKSRDGRKIYWRCSQRDICNATCITGSNLEGNIQVFKVGTHLTHHNRRAQIQVRETMNNIKRKANENPNQPPSAIVQEQIHGVTNEESVVLLPERQSLLRTVNRLQNLEA